jgi:chemotaxis response regulator CheB
MASSNDTRIRVLIISLPGMMQNVLRESIIRRQDVEVVGIAGGCLSATAMLSQAQPDLVVIDSNLPETEVGELILHLKKLHTSITSLVLVETTQQLNKAAHSGADFTLRSYCLPECLDSVFGNLNAGS